ncbi:putative inorganic phosphate cotransporter isoform X3 [Diabrotica virgifera virgifera]|uniref:Major facilitator superfamily (MFS) profile domain-containing protein n=1 Tax=Diabrotica virgifera virgifera TaxID=50390 RepID=A0ABM5L5L2_DIAVI|nr:putative inorganic phosphate cotransporter isoform X3 [Diabrotica virgifera virgifera]
MPWHPLKCLCGKFTLGQRYVLVIMMQLALLNAYHLRVVLNIAITEMIQDRNNVTSHACPNYIYEPIEEIHGGTFKWNHDLEAGILYAFFTSYFISHVPGGWLADKFGGRHVMGTCMVVSSVVSILTPLAIQYGSSWGAIILRIILGFAQGPMLPTISTFIQCWIPKHQRGFLGGIAFGGSNMGTVTGSILTGMMITGTKSWVVPFYVWGICSLVWCIFYYLHVFSRPVTHPFITEEEKNYLINEVEQKTKFKVPWKSICTSLPVWGLLAGQLSHNFIFFTLLTDLPKYLKEILKMNVRANATTTALPFLALWVANIFFAYVADFVTNRNLLSLVVARKLYTSFACIVPSLLLILMVYVGCSRVAAQVLVTVAFFLVGPFFSGMKVNVNDITIHYGGTIMAIVNGLGSLTGIVGPYMVGAIAKNETLEEWRLCMWIILAVSIFLSVIYCLTAKAERQSWDYPEKEDENSKVGGT